MSKRIAEARNIREWRAAFREMKRRDSAPSERPPNPPPPGGNRYVAPSDCLDLIRSRLPLPAPARERDHKAVPHAPQVMSVRRAGRVAAGPATVLRD